MPCNSDYMEANIWERQLSRVLALLEEVRTGKHVDTRSDTWRGYHPKVYNEMIQKETADGWVAKLCKACTRLAGEGALTEYSLELQTWWRDHQRADARRVKEEARAELDATVRRRALKKLTPGERKALGLKDG